MTPAERWMQRVRELPCLICLKMGLPQMTPTAAHHAFDTAHRSDWLTVALCHDHHQSNSGFHGIGQRAFERRYHTDELHLLAETIEKIGRLR
jgi:hypothetical protein